MVAAHWNRRRDILNPDVYCRKVLSFDPDKCVVSSELYKDYSEYCLDHGFGAVAHIPFSRSVCRRLGARTKLMRIEGRVCRVLVGVAARKSGGV